MADAQISLGVSLPTRADLARPLSSAIVRAVANGEWAAVEAAARNNLAPPALCPARGVARKAAGEEQQLDLIDAAGILLIAIIGASAGLLWHAGRTSVSRVCRGGSELHDVNVSRLDGRVSQTSITVQDAHVDKEGARSWVGPVLDNSDSGVEECLQKLLVKFDDALKQRLQQNADALATGYGTKISAHGETLEVEARVKLE